MNVNGNPCKQKEKQQKKKKKKDKWGEGREIKMMTEQVRVATFANAVTVCCLKAIKARRAGDTYMAAVLITARTITPRITRAWTDRHCIPGRAEELMVRASVPRGTIILDRAL